MISVVMRSVGLLLAGVGIAWALFASFFTANEYIESFAELVSYYISGVLTLIGLALIGFPFVSLSKRMRTVLIAVTVAALCTVMCACIYSDETFMFWKLRSTSATTWKQMSDDLQVFGRTVAKEDSSGLGNFRHMKMPSSFAALGLNREFAGGNAGGGLNPYVFYGSTKGRRWGIVIGSNYFSGGNWALSKRIMVSDNAYFFVGPNF